MNRADNEEYEDMSEILKEALRKMDFIRKKQYRKNEL